MSVTKGSRSARNPQLVQMPRGSGKANMSQILQGMDFGKLEQTAMVHTAKSKSVLVSTPSITGMSLEELVIESMGWYDNLWEPPKPHCQTKVFDIIDKFWENPGSGVVQLYLEQLNKNPKTKDVFKGRSTTHHYPWYRRGTKY